MVNHPGDPGVNFPHLPLIGKPHMFIKRILYYLNPATLFGKSDPNVNLRMMHGINRISILLFMACLALMIARGCAR